jgi:outer membrane protein OmpA-like peptidoglycan-associated protein
MTWHSTFALPFPQLLVLATSIMTIAGSALAQNTNPRAVKPAGTADGGYSLFDVSPYIGWQWFQAYSFTSSYPAVPRAHDFDGGAGFGVRFTEDVANHFAIEENIGVGFNRLQLQPSGETGFVSLPNRNLEFGGNLVLNFLGRRAKVRPFILGGAGYIEYYPGSVGSISAPAGVTYIAPTTFLAAGERVFTFGAGVNVNFNRRFGTRFDIRALTSPSPSFSLQNVPGTTGTLYIPWNQTSEHSLLASVGLVIRMDYIAPPATPVTGVNQTLRVDLAPAPTGSVTVTGAHNVCSGDDLRLTTNAAGFPNATYQWQVGGSAAPGATGTSFSAPTTTGTGPRSVSVMASVGSTMATSAPFAIEPNHTYRLTAEVPALAGRAVTYQWIVNGQPVAGATSSSYDLPNGGPQSVTVQATVQNPPVTSAPVTFTIQPLTPPTPVFSINPGTVSYTSGPISLQAVATPSQCGGPVTVRYSGEAVTGSTFNPGSVSGFDMGNRLRQQTRTVTITATATDAKNQTATRTAAVTVTFSPEARRLDDIVFPNMSSRVNNCGKRLLLEELTPMLRNDPGAKVILIGHRDEHEKGSKTALALDETRVLDAAAALSAGTGICPQLDLSRIMMKAVGTDQSSTPRPALCGASTNVKEKAGQVVKESDKNAEYRRVEVWIVPSGAADPAGVTGLTPVPADRVTKLGCPK